MRCVLMKKCDILTLIFLPVVGIILFTHCASPAPATRGSRPKHATTAPAYKIDEQLLREIHEIEQDLLESPHNTDLLVQLAGLYMDVGDGDNALRIMEQLKALNYTATPQVYSSLGKLYDDRGEYKLAKENYTLFKELVKDNNDLLTKTDLLIEALDFKIKTLATPFSVVLRRISSDINTADSEYLSQFTLNAKQIIFTRRFNEQEDLFMAQKTPEGYDITPIEAVNTPLNEGAHTISADGSTLIFTHCNEKFGFGSCDLYLTTLQADGLWRQPSNMGAKINTRHWEAQPSLSADGNSLYFSSTRPEGSYGASDIWVATRQADGTWGYPKNLGKAVNTAARDESPFIHADDRTLYFRSEGHPSLGSFDIYMSSLMDTKWAAPIHLGSPINTAGNDGALVVSLDGTKGYYATDTYQGVVQNHLDIFEFELPTVFRPQPMTYVQGRVTDGVTLMPIKATITVRHDLDQSAPTYSANYNGEFLIAIPVGQPTHMHITGDGYLFYSDYIYYDVVKHGVDPHIIDITLSKVTAIETPDESPSVVLRNIFFETGSSELLASSRSELDYLYELLLGRPTLKIELIGHTDNIGATDDNLKLSEARATAVKQAIVDRGIDARRISVLGKGASQPIATNDTAEGRAVNRRTELKLIP